MKSEFEKPAFVKVHLFKFSDSAFMNDKKTAEQGRGGLASRFFDLAGLQGQGYGETAGIDLGGEGGVEAVGEGAGDGEAEAGGAAGGVDGVEAVEEAGIVRAI